MAEQELHTFLFADISGYSRLSEEGGDEVAAELAIRFAEAAERAAREHGAEMVKQVGDAVMVRCDCAAELVCLGLRLHEELGERTPIHAGIHTGRALERGGDWWGTTVNVASRVADAADTGQLLITEATKREAGDLGKWRLRAEHVGDVGDRDELRASFQQRRVGIHLEAAVVADRNPVDLGPGPVTAGCDDPATEPRLGEPLEIVDPEGLWVSTALPCQDQFSQAIDYIQGAEGESSEPLEVARTAMEGMAVEPGDVFEPAGYPEAEAPQVRVVRDGAPIAVVGLFSDGGGKWLVGTITACSSLEGGTR